MKKVWDPVSQRHLTFSNMHRDGFSDALYALVTTSRKASTKGGLVFAAGSLDKVDCNVVNGSGVLSLGKVSLISSMRRRRFYFANRST